MNKRVQRVRDVVQSSIDQQHKENSTLYPKLKESWEDCRPESFEVKVTYLANGRQGLTEAEIVEYVNTALRYMSIATGCNINGKAYLWHKVEKKDS